MIIVENKKELIGFIKQRIKEQGPKCDLNDIDVSKVTDMSHLFYWSKFNGDISKWDVSKVEGMNGMFNNSLFNDDISKWDVSNVEDMYCMFYNSPLSGREPKWYRPWQQDVGNVKDMSYKTIRDDNSREQERAYRVYQAEN